MLAIRAMVFPKGRNLEGRHINGRIGYHDMSQLGQTDRLESLFDTCSHEAAAAAALPASDGAHESDAVRRPRRGRVQIEKGLTKFWMASPDAGWATTAQRLNDALALGLWMAMLVLPQVLG